VTVRVLRSDGNPAGGVMVTVPRSSVPIPEMALVANAAGVATLHLPSGRFTVEAFTEDGDAGSAELTIEADGVRSVDVEINVGRRQG